MKKADIVRMFAEERPAFEARYERVKDATLKFSKFKRDGPRSCCVTNIRTCEVHFHSDVIIKLDEDQCRALIRHELAHVCDPDISESDTDRLAEIITGQPIYYGHDDIQTLYPCKYPRPSYLPEW